MDSPLKYDEALKSELGVTKDIELSDVEKLGYVRSQFDEIKKLLFRERLELMMAEAQTKSDLEAFAADAKSKVAQHRTQIKNIILTLGVVKSFVGELESVVDKGGTE